MVKKVRELNEPYAEDMDVKDLFLVDPKTGNKSLQSNELLKYLHN